VRPDETISGMGEGRIKEKMEGVSEFNYDTL
jgi:hypothetical protein